MREYILIGNYDTSKSSMFYVFFDKNKTAKKEFKKCLGSKQETEAVAVGSLLKYAAENKFNIRIYTNFVDAVKYAQGETKAVSKRITDFVKYLNKIKSTIEFELISNIDEQSTNKILKILLEQKALQNSTFRVVIKKETDLVHDLCEKDFGSHNVADAIFLANWYENRGYQVERYNF